MKKLTKKIKWLPQKSDFVPVKDRQAKKHKIGLNNMDKLWKCPNLLHLKFHLLFFAINSGLFGTNSRLKGICKTQTCII